MIFVQSLIARSRFASTLTILQLFASIETHRSDRKAEMDRFVCLAEYGCRCRPPGKPVDKSTMKRHRAISNRKRASLGLPKLPRGPRHSFSASQSVSNHFYRLQEKRLLENMNAKRLRSIEMDVCDENNGENHMEQHGDKGCSGDEVDVESERHDLGRSDSSSFGGDSDSSSMFESSTEEALEDMSSLLEDPSCALQDVQDPLSTIPMSQENEVLEIEKTENHQDVANNFSTRALNRARFKSWCESNKKWVYFGVKFSLPATVMDSVLENISSSYKSWKTIRRNMAKYSNLLPISYRTCRGHMLLNKADFEFNVSGVMVPEPQGGFSGCTVCLERDEFTKITSFEYLPLLPRIRAWVQNEKTCKVLYDYVERRKKSKSADDDEYIDDFFSGWLFKKIVSSLGGDGMIENDIFISLSCDGFQPYGNRKYDCWPIVALVHNLPPQMRFLMWNVIPLGVIKGPKEPVLLHTFLLPLLEEVSKINHNGGTPIKFWDGSVRKVRVHVLWVTGDSPAVAKLAGLTGSNGKCPCRFCEIVGFRLSGSNHYYFPSKIRVSNGTRSKYELLYDPENLDCRSEESVNGIWESLESPCMTSAQKRKINVETGIKRKTTVMKLDTVFPFSSFPIDTMHLFLNLIKDLMSIWKGDSVHIQRSGFSRAEFVLSAHQWEMIDKEFARIGSGTCERAFGSVPLDSSWYSSWKATQCKDFAVLYAPILMEGHLPSRLMDGLWCFSNVVELCSRASLSKEDVGCLHESAIYFLKNFEKNYFGYDPRRVGLCKSTLHQILHLRDCVEACGPPVIYSQFWVERYIGFIKKRLNATNLAAESIFEGEKLLESYKLFFSEPFTTPEEHTSDEERKLLFPDGEHFLSELSHPHLNLRRLLCEYIMKTANLTSAEAHEATKQDRILSFGALENHSGNGSEKYGAKESKRHFSGDIRPDYFISAQFKVDGGNNSISVYYGRILRILRYNFHLSSGISTQDLILADWVSGLKRTRWDQVYRVNKGSNIFSSPTVEDPSVLLNIVGVLNHSVPKIARTRRGIAQHVIAEKVEERYYIMDPFRRIHQLLDAEKCSPDGINRTLQGMK